MGGTAFYRYEDYFDLEAEAQVSNHFNEDSYWEFVAGLAFRWRYFPWGNTVATSLAVGTGLSFATKETQLEIDKNGDTRRVLGYLMIELAVRPTPRSPWQIFGRLHHRSGLFGLFDDVQGGSNFYGIGIRYDF
jgi:hypothetical protein